MCAKKWHSIFFQDACPIANHYLANIYLYIFLNDTAFVLPVHPQNKYGVAPHRRSLSSDTN